MIEEISTKTCKKCGETKPLNGFRFKKYLKSGDGYGYWEGTCQSCCNKKQIERYHFRVLNEENYKQNINNKQAIKRYQDKLKMNKTQLSATNEKILSAVPLSDSWNLQQISKELTRSHQLNIAIATIQNGLNALVGLEYVAETTRGYYKRLSKESAIKKTPTELFLGLQEKLSKAFILLSELKHEIDSASIEIEKSLDEKEPTIKKEDLEKFEHFKALMGLK